MYIFIEKLKSTDMQGWDLGCKGRAFTFNFINVCILICYIASVIIVN